MVKVISIDGVDYVRKDEAIPEVSGDYVIVRSRDAGVFAGVISERVDGEVLMERCRRLWYWSGACSLSQLAMEGTKKPTECKFSMVTVNNIVLGVIEIIPCTKEAVKSIEGVAVWKQ